ncbi:GH3 auxin-responsive promoter [Infundibulicybe gibba]|nr:GH3 auxin-responsive promoter [Infundibulicybe gibba]
MTPPTTTPVLQTLSAQQVEGLKQRISGALSYIVNTNSLTTYFRNAPLLARYRTELQLDATHDLAAVPGTSTPGVNLGTFSKSVPLSTYEDYRPYISRFMETPCLQSSVDSLLAPGFPAFIATSSGTSGGSAKYFPKYMHPMKWTVSSMAASTPEVDGPTKCAMFSLRYTHTLDILDGQGAAKKIPFSFVAAGTLRNYHEWGIEDDAELIKTRISGQVTPVAVAFIKSYHTFLLLHALFAMSERSLTTFNTTFITIFSDLVRLIKDHWEDLVRAIETGEIPNFEGLDDLRPHIQTHLHPRPDRAEELRKIGANMHAVGWLKQIWPNLTLVIGNATGPFSAVLPSVQISVGPSVSVQSIVYASSEAWVGTIYNPKSGDNLYKIETANDVFEYLDVEQPESAEYVTQAWDLEVGKKYEVILTTRDGFWRYRQGDVLEMIGFAPEDGSPLFRFLERRNAVMRVAGEFVSEAELHQAVRSIEDDIGRVTEFTVVVDDRRFPQRYGFLLELESELEPGFRAHAVPHRLQEFLASTNSTFARFNSDSVVGEPSVRVLAAGTFSGYRSWKVGVSGGGSGQTKVPTIIYDPEARDWLLGHVVQELGAERNMKIGFLARWLRYRSLKILDRM